MTGSFLIDTPYERARRELTKPSGTPKEGKRSGWYGNNAGLHVKSTLRDEPLYVDTLGGNYVYEYDVTVNVEGIDLTYSARYGSSINDYSEGIVNAREAAFGCLRELCDFIYESAEGFIENVCGESWEDIPPEMKEKMKRAEAAAEAFEGALLANGDVVMS